MSYEVCVGVDDAYCSIGDKGSGVLLIDPITRDLLFLMYSRVPGGNGSWIEFVLSRIIPQVKPPSKWIYLEKFL